MPVFPELLEDQFPKTTTTSQGTTFQIRTLGALDKNRLWEFFKEIPDNDKLYLKEDLSDPKIAEEWCRNINYDQMLPLIALVGSKIIGYATLQQHQRTWQRHIGLVRVAVHPDYRKMGIARTLLDHICELGQHCGLEKLEAEFVAEQTNAMHLFEMCGFVKTAILPKHVVDIKGNRHDFVIMLYNMRDVERHEAD